MTVIPIIVGAFGMVPKEKIGVIGNQRKDQEYPEYNII